MTQDHMATHTSHSSTQTVKTALIAGGGLAGLAAALYLDEQGYQITLVEQKPVLGGRTFAFKDRHTGIFIDNGQHVMMGAYHDTLSLLERVGAKHNVTVQIPTHIPLLFTNQAPGFLSMYPGNKWLSRLRSFLFFKGMTLTEKKGLLKLAYELYLIKNNKKNYPDSLTVKNWLTQFDQGDHAFANFWTPLTLATINAKPETAAATSLAQVLIQGYFADPYDGFMVIPNKNLNDVFVKPIVTYLRMRGHHILAQTTLKEIHILDHTVRSYKFADQSEKKADIYFSALPPHALAQVLPKAFLQQHAQLRSISNFTSTPIVSVNLFFDQDFMTTPFLGTTSHQIHWFFKKENPVLQKQGLYHITALMSDAFAFLDTSKQDIIFLALQNLHDIYPKAKKAKLMQALVNKERMATLKNTVALNQQRPQQKILSNFYVIGDWTQTHIPATIESAVRSAKMAVSLLAEE